MKKLIAILGASLLSVGVLTACGSSSSSDVKTGGSNDVAKKKTQTQQQPKDDGSKKFNAGVSQNVSGLAINVADIKIEKDRVTLGMNEQNTTQQKLTFYPDQGNIVIGDMQLEANSFMGSGDVSGDINGGVKKDGTIVFTVPEGKTLDVSKVTQLTLNFGDVYNDATMDTKTVTITVPVK